MSTFCRSYEEIKTLKRIDKQLEVLSPVSSHADYHSAYRDCMHLLAESSVELDAIRLRRLEVLRTSAHAQLRRCEEAARKAIYEGGAR